MKSSHYPLLLALIVSAPGAFAATLTFSASAPTATANAISNFVGAAYDANNVGGSGVNSNGGANNGPANDGTTYVASDRPVQGQTFTTGTNAGGYTLSSITVRMQGYTSNTASGSNIGGYSLSGTSSTFRVRVGRISGTTFIPYTVEYAASGGAGSPGTSGTMANGPGTYLTFTLKAPFVLKPNTVYAFDIGSSSDYFEMLGIRDAASGGNPYSTGTAYTSGSSGSGGGTITTQTGDRVFQVNLTAYTPPAPGAFVHPGLLNTETDFERMRTNVAQGVEPWLSNYNALKSSWMANTGWGPHAQATITRGSFNDSSRLYNDVAVAYSCALVWKISGDTAYADEAVRILNAWGYTFTSIAGDTNIALNELYGCQLAMAAEIMRTYPGWAAADFAQFQTMIYNVFYSLADSFLTSHFGTGDSHYWANWDLASMSTLYAIGVLNDNATLTTRSLNYFYGGQGNGCIDRAVNFIHPGYQGQGQEMGRDQGHATLDIAQIAAYCQMAWNQGTDLFGYENNRVLAMAEYTAKYNLGNDVPWTNYGYDVYWPTVWLQTGVSSGSRGDNQRPGWPTLYNHYVNVMGLSAPYTKQMADNMGVYWGFNGDVVGWDQLTTALPPIASGTNPSALSTVLNGQKPLLSWWGSAYATSYNVKRSTTSGTNYTTIATGVTTNTYTDTSAVSGTYYYIVTGSLSGGGTTGNSNEAQAILGSPVFVQLNFNETSGTTTADSTGNGWNGTLVNGATWTTGTHGNAVNLSKASSQYVSLPAGIVADVSDMTVSAWVYQTSASNYANIFNFGSGDNFYGGWSPWNYPTWLPERYMYLVAQDGNGKVRFGISRSTPVGEESMVGASALPTGQWVHVTVTLSAGIGTLYVNGVAVGQNLNMPMTPMQFPPTTQNYIGKSQSRNDPYFDGKIDDFRIYRGALSTGSVYTLATGLVPATPPPAPTNLTATAQAGNQTLLTWTASPGAATYTISRSTTAGGPYTAVASIVSGTSYTDTGLTAGTTYYYVINGANTGGDGSVSTQSNAIIALPPIPSVPTGVNAFASSSSAITINWTAAANAYTYSVKRSLTSGGPYTTLATGLTSLTYTDPGLTAGTTYYYVVTSVNTAGESANSAENSAAPSDLLVHIRFDESSGTTSPDVSGNGWDSTLVNAPTWTTGVFGNSILFTATSSQYATLPTNVVANTNDFTISTWVKMSSIAANARIFDFGTSTTPSATAGTYMFLTPSSGSAVRFAITTAGYNNEKSLTGTGPLTTGTWTHVAVTLSGSTGKLYVSGSLVATGTGVTLNPASLGSTTQNYIGRSRFSADPYLNGGIDDFRIYSRALSATEITALVNPSPTTPTGLTAVSADSLVSLNWAVDESAGTYNVKRATVSGGPFTTIASGITTPSFTDTGVTGDTTYYYVVSAVNRLGESANSAQAASTPFVLTWASGDIGAVAATGGSSVSGQTVTVIGSGTDIWTTADECQFRQVAVAGDCMITARVISVQNTDPWAKAGVMIRGSLAADSMNAALLVTPTTTHGITWQKRLTNGAISSNTGFTGTAPPYWVRITRTGSSIQGFRSADGANWVSCGTVTLSLGATAYVGLAVTSHVDGTTCTATFDNIAVNWLPNPPADLAITPTSKQIALNWTASSNAASYNIKRSLTSGGPYSTIATGVTAPAYTDTGLSDSGAYYYVISASNIIGESVNSSEQTATTYTALENWRLANFGTIVNSGNSADSADPDGDGMTNAQEFAAGTNPNNSASALKVSSVIKSGNNMLVSFLTVLGKTYRLEASNTLQSGSWTTVQDNIAGTGGTVQITDTNGASQPKRFYHVVIQ